MTKIEFRILGQALRGLFLNNTVAYHCSNLFDHASNAPVHRELFFDHNGLIAPPKKRTIPLWGSVESLCIYPVNMAHYQLKVTMRCLKSDMVMDFHETIENGPDIPSAPCIFE